MSVSPSGSMLASIDVSGNLSLWEIPSFRLKRRWTPQELVSDYTCIIFSLFEADDCATLFLSLYTQPQVANTDTRNRKGKLGHQVVS